MEDYPTKKINYFLHSHDLSEAGAETVPVHAILYRYMIARLEECRGHFNLEFMMMITPKKIADWYSQSNQLNGLLTSSD